MILFLTACTNELELSDDEIVVNESWTDTEESSNTNNDSDSVSEYSKNVEIILTNDFPKTLELGSPLPDFKKMVEFIVDGKRVVVREENFLTNLNTSELGTYNFIVQVLDDEQYLILKEENYLIDVIDTNAPTIALIGSSEVVINVFDDFIDPSANIYDYDKNTFLITEGSINTNIIGDYVLTYKAIDTSGNESDLLSRIIKVVDTVSPTFSEIPDEVILEFDVDLELEIPSCEDNYDKECTVKTTQFDNKFLGRQEVEYRATDSSGNSTKAITRITIVDTIPPTIELIGPEYIVLDWFTSSYTFPEVRVSDNYPYYSLSPSYTTNLQLDTPGDYTVRIEISDASNNTSFVEQSVRVLGIKTVSEIELEDQPTLIFKSSNGFIIISTRGDNISLGTNNCSVTFADQTLNTIIKYEDYCPSDAKVHNERLYVSSNKDIFIYNLTGQLINQFSITDDIHEQLKSFDFYSDGRIIILIRNELAGSYSKLIVISSDGNPVGEYNLDGIDISGKITLIDNENILISSPTRGLFIYRPLLDELTKILDNGIWQSKIIDGFIYSVGQGVHKLDLKGNVIISNQDTAIIGNQLTNITKFNEGFLISGRNSNLTYLDSNISTIKWVYNLYSQTLEPRYLFWAYNVLVTNNGIYISGQNPINGNSLISVLKYE